MAVARKQRNAPVGETIGLAFGGLWCFLGAHGLPAAMTRSAASAGAALTVLLLLFVWLRPAPAYQGARPRSWIIAIAIALELAALIAANTLLPRYGLADWLLPAVGIIVGLHFIGFWIATRESRFLGIAFTMCAISAGAMFIPPGDPFNPRAVGAGFGNALALWIGAAWPMTQPKGETP